MRRSSTYGTYPCRLGVLRALANYALAPHAWIAGPTLVALGGVILVYVASAVIHDSGRHPALSNY